jgi:hypothetical protein
MEYYSKNPVIFSEIYDSIIKLYEEGTVPREDVLDTSQLENMIN